MASTATSTSSAPAPAPAPAPSSGPFKIVFRTMQSLVLLIVLMGAVIAFAWLVMNPRPPAFRLDSLSLSSLLDVSNTSSPPPKLHVQMQLTATNPNKKVKLSLVIQDVDFLLIHCGHRFHLSSHKDASSSAYCIGKRGHRVLTLNAEAGLRPGLGTRRKWPFQFAPRNGSAVMSVGMQVSVKFVHRYWPSKRASVKVTCRYLSIQLLSSTRTGGLKDGGKDCSVGFA